MGVEWEKRLKREGIHGHPQLIHSVVQQKLRHSGKQLYSNNSFKNQRGKKKKPIHSYPGALLSQNPFICCFIDSVVFHSSSPAMEDFFSGAQKVIQGFLKQQRPKPLFNQLMPDNLMQNLEFQPIFEKLFYQHVYNLENIYMRIGTYMYMCIYTYVRIKKAEH